MKVLFLSHYTENSEWGILAQGLIFAMHSAGLDIVTRNIIREEKQVSNISSIIKECEGKNVDGCTHCIQFVEPSNMIITQKFSKNIAILFNKEDDMKRCEYISILDMFDQVWALSEVVEKQLNEALKIPIRKLLPTLVDLNRCIDAIYDNSYDNINLEVFSPNSVGKNIKELLSE